ncbi:histidinol-phosphatase HisJ [Paenibacillus cymbidii]|uniref:histidinol-phosphatase HisJ n=1 Tax=Paenibacillus cymbidii TaxID=1639034 RepID=UPI0010801D6F|nr:histidinol-phosphatase HisJ [Paenibacillus cymbidii]
MTLKWDGHTHTKFCYHGNDAEQEAYLDRALALGFERYTISEHPPLPQGWVEDGELFRELAMPMDELPAYMAYAKAMKRQYEGRLDVTVGLELDYLPGAFGFTERIVDEWQGELEDVVYSVHYLRGRGGVMQCVDYKPDHFAEHLLAYYGTMTNVVDEYYDHVEAAIARAGHLPSHIRKRIGHINLIEKFASALPPIDENHIRRRLEAILPLLAATGVGIDVNTAGMRVATCGKPYVPAWFLAACRARGIACVYGSDSHKPDHVGFGWEWFAAQSNIGR